MMELLQSVLDLVWHHLDVLLSSSTPFLFIGGGGGGGKGSPLDVAANVATGGLSGVVQNVVAGDPLAAAASAGPFGGVAQPTLGTGPALQAELAGTAAGVAGGGLAGGGFGTAGASEALTPASVFPAETLVPPGVAAQAAQGAPFVPLSAPFATDTLVASELIPSILAAPVLASGAVGGGAGLGGAAGGGGTGGINPLAAALLAQQLGGLAGSFFQQPAPNIPAPFPIGGALPTGPTPAQLSAIASTPHPGLAPWFAARQHGQSLPTSITESPFGTQGQGGGGVGMPPYELMLRYPQLFMRG